MTFQRVNPTRASYYELKSRLKFLARGENLLEIKRDQIYYLIKKVKRRYDAYLHKARQRIRRAMYLFRVTLLYSDKKTLQILTYIFKKTPVGALMVTRASRFGIEIPKLHLKLSDRARFPPYSLVDTAASLDDTIMAFRKAFRTIVKLAECEATLFTYTFEFQKVNQRLTALREKKIPATRDQFREIEEILEDLDREEYVRMHTIKETIEGDEYDF